MLKKGRTLIALACAVCLLAAVASGTAAGSRDTRTNIGRIEQGSIAIMGEMPVVPEDCSGFTLLIPAELPGGALEEILPGLPAPEADGSTGMLRCPLDEGTARSLLENAYAASIAPDRSILLFLYNAPTPAMLVWRGKTLVLMAQSSSRGAPDADGALRGTLGYKLVIAPDPAEGEVRWSPDSRYLFFNDTERWRGARISLNDPYLLDTYTGEIFLIENSGYPKNPMQDTFRCVMNGCFSADGKSFYWYCRDYVSGIQPTHFLMRYDLETGAEETVCQLQGAMLDFCEISVNRWLLLETAGDETRLVRLSLSPDGIRRTEEVLPGFCSSARFFPAVRENVLLAATPRSSGGTYLLPLTWDESAASWYKIGSISADGLQAISGDEIEAELEAAKRGGTVISGGENIGTAYIRHAAAIIGVTDLLLTVYIREPVPDSWGGGFSDLNGQVILNTENLRLFPIRTGAVPDGLRDSLIDGTMFLAKNYGYDMLGLYAVYSLPDFPFLKGETYRSPYGTFQCRNESNPLSLSSVTLKSHECGAEISVGNDSYLIRFRVADYPEPENSRRVYTVPEALTGDRWNEVTSAMSKKDQKKLSTLYMKITPEKLAERENRDELLAAYPSAATETVYILRSEIKPQNLETAETLLSSAGYTAEDYARDLETVAVPTEANVVVGKNGRDMSSKVIYTFSVPDPGLYPGGGRILELAGLCERIGKAVMANRQSAKPLPLESVILEKYDMGSVDFYVTVDLIETAENTLEFTLSVHP